MWSLLQMIGWPFLVVRNFLALTVATASIQLWQQKLEVFRPELCCHAASHYVAVDQHHWKQPNKTLASQLRLHIDLINAWNDDYTQKRVNDCLLSWELRGQPCPCVLDAAPACTICFVTKHSYELRIYILVENSWSKNRKVDISWARWEEPHRPEPFTSPSMSPQRHRCHLCYLVLILAVSQFQTMSQ